MKCYVNHFGPLTTEVISIKNIWIVNHYAVSPELPGGTRHFDIGKVLVERGYKVTIFAAGYNHWTLKEEKIRGRESWREEYIEGVRFIWIRTPPYKRNDYKRVINVLTFSLRVLLLCMALKEKPDVIVGSSPHFFAPLSAYIIARKRKARFIYEDRDLWGQTLTLTPLNKGKRFFVSLMAKLEKFLYQRAWKIISVPPGGIEILKKLGIPSNKIYHIPNGVDISYFQIMDKNLPKELDSFLRDAKRENYFLIVHTGRLHRAYGLDNVLQCSSLLNSRGYTKIHFVLVGDGEDKERLLGIKEKLGLQNVHFFPLIPKTTLPYLLKQCDVALACLNRVPRYKITGLSLNKLVHYMASGIPVITAIEALNNPIEEAGSGLSVEPENPEALCSAIISFYNMDSKERKEMGRKGLEYIKNNLSTPVLGGKFLKVIEDERY
jgi:glycosyltransferase involved in cell wall biosynthesis